MTAELVLHTNLSTELEIHPQYRWRRFRQVCARCRGPFEDGHVCHDQLRHKSFLLCLLAFKRILENTDELGRTMDVIGSLVNATDRPWLCLCDIEKQELLVAVMAFAWGFGALPETDSTLVVTYLERCGFPAAHLQSVLKESG